MATPLYLAELVVYDPSAGGLTTLRYASGAGHVTGPAETPANTFYDARIKQPVTIRRDLFSAGKLGGRSRVGYGDLVLHNGDGGVDALLGYALQGRAVTIRRGTPGAAYPSGFTTIFSGTMEQAEAVGDTLVVKLRDKQLDLMVPLQTTKYAGSNSLPDGVEGVEGDLKGKSKPVCFGQVFNVPVPCVNTAKLIYQVADRSVTVDAVYDAGIPLLAGFPLTARTHGFSAYGIFGIAYGADTFVAVGLAGRIETSPDGTTWTVRTSGFGSESISAVAFGNGLFVAVGLGGALATSPDGITWTARTSSFGTDPIGAVAYGNGQWVATGYAGKIATSPDGITWTQRTSPFSASDYLFLLAYGNGRWIAASIDAMATSVDGATWALGTSGFAVGQYHQTVAYGGGLFILAGTSGLLSTSPDGITWTARSPGFGTISIKGAFYGPGLGSLPPGWVIVGENGLAATSTDGINWTALTTGQSGAFLNQVVFGDGRFVVIGTTGAGAGLIASSGGGPSYASLADLQDDDATPEAGTFRAYSGAEGTYIRLGASPYGQITADATEGTSAADRTAGQLFVKVLQRAGKATGDWSASDVTALDTANSAVLGDWFMGDDTFADVLDRIATTVGAWWGADADGVYRIQQLTAPSGTAVYAATANDLLRPLARLAISDDTKGLPSWRSILRYKRNYAVQPGAGGAGGASSPATAGGPWLDVNDMVIATGSTTPRSVRDRFAEVFNVKDYGAKGDGATDDTAAIAAAIAATGVGGVLYFPPGTYKTTSAVLLDTVGLKVRADGYQSTTLVKYHTGNALTVDAAGIEIRGLALTAATDTSATYAGGAAIRFETDSHFPLVDGVHTSEIDIGLDFDADSAKYGHFSNLVLDPYTQTAGSEGRSIYFRGTDTGAMHRRFVNLVGQGIVDFGEVFDTLIVNGIFRRPVWSSAAASITLLDNCIWGSLGQAMTINGVNTVVRGCRFAGDVTLSSGMTGVCAFTDNIQTSGTFTDSTSASVCMVRHHPLAENYHRLDKHKVYSGSTTGGVVRTGRTVAPGDAAYTWNPYEGVSDVLYNTTLTAARAVTLSTTSAFGGAAVLVRRTASGAFLLDVGGLVNLAPMEWCWVVYTGSAYVVVAAGKVQQVGTLAAGLRVAEDDMSGTTQYGVQVDSVTQSDATVNGIGVYARVQTAAAAFTQATGTSLYAANPSAGAGSTITTAVGLHVENITAGGTNNFAIRTGTGRHSFGDDLEATGGFRQTIDGWTQDNVAASQTNVELTRATGRFRAVRAGSVTGVIVTSTEARTAGTLTVTVFKNTGLAGAAGGSIGLTAVLDGTNTSRKATTQAKDADTFAAGDELYAVVTTDGSWTPTTADIRVAVEIED